MPSLLYMACTSLKVCFLTNFSFLNCEVYLTISAVQTGELIIESAEALPILCVRYARWEREIQREREIDGSDVIIVAVKLAMSLHSPMPKIRTIALGSHFPLPKMRNFVSHFTLPGSAPFLNGHHCGAEIRNEVTLSDAKTIRPLCSDSLWNGTSRATSDRKPKTNDQILPSPNVLPIEKMNQINTKNYWK